VKSVYIISYFGEKNKEARKTAHQDQLSFFKLKGYRIVVCSMRYQPNDYEEGVEYIDSPLVSPGEARNILLKRFYQSDEDWAVFADNDSWWKDEGKYNPTGKSIEDEIDAHKIFDHIDAFGFMDGRVTAYNSILVENQNKVSFKINPQFRGCCFFMKNIRKSKGVEVYFSKNFVRADGSFIMGEDLGFALSLVSAGFRVFQCQNVVLVEKCVNASTWASSSSERKLLYQEMNKTCITTVPGLHCKINGSLDTRGFYESKNHPKSKIFTHSLLDNFNA
jgi:hypothetical protein